MFKLPCCTTLQKYVGSSDGDIGFTSFILVRLKKRASWTTISKDVLPSHDKKNPVDCLVNGACYCTATCTTAKAGLLVVKMSENHEQQGILEAQRRDKLFPL